MLQPAQTQIVEDMMRRRRALFAVEPSAPADVFRKARTALRDIVGTMGAVDGALAVPRGHDLKVVESIHGQFSRRTISGDHCEAVAAANAGTEAVWLEPSAPEGLYLAPHMQVLFIPFATSAGPASALLAFHQRIHLSTDDLRFFQRAFGGAPGLPEQGELPAAA